MKSMLDEDKEILQDFVTESNEAIEKTELLLLQLEENIAKNEAIDKAHIDAIFRTFHSIKGSAGFLALERTNSLTHHAETLLDLLRKNKVSVLKVHVDILLEVCDNLQVLLDHIGIQFSEDGFSGDIAELEKRLHRLTTTDSESKTNETAQNSDIKHKPEEKKEKTQNQVKKQKKKTDDRSEKAAAESSPPPNVAETEASANLNESLITPDMVAQFVVEVLELLDTLEQDLLALEADPTNKTTVESAFRALHSIKGNAGFFNYSDIGALAHKGESFLDLVRRNKIVASSRQISLILKVLDFIRAAIVNLSEGRPPVVMGKFGLLDLMDEVFTAKSVNTTEAESAAETPEQKESDLASEAIDTAEKEMKSEAATARQDEAAKKEVIRVDIDKLNKLMDLVGEIVIAESMVSHNPFLAGKELEGFEKSIGYLQKNIRELQDLAMSMRMIPLSGVFGKMRRLVRDISEKKKNQVELNIEGGETEVDRSVIEHISDPLVHIIRNAIDHGIELPEERIKRGKTLAGTILLEAKRSGGEIWVLVSDDGAGLNKEKILRKAKEKGLVNGSEELSDHDIYNLIFAPGLSTAKEVTSISGRGVGMDVVSRNVEKIRGRVEVDSEPGMGTTITLKIPLTTAIVDGMLMQVGSMLYAIPTLDIKESLQVKSDNVVRLTDGQEVIKVREHLIPVLRLQELHRLIGKKKELEQGIVVVTESGGNAVGFLVDEIIGQQQLVIKPMPYYIGKVEGVSGCAVLGNGEICLILDLTNLVRYAETMAIN